jgi:hypothetical protein
LRMPVTSMVWTALPLSAGAGAAWPQAAVAAKPDSVHAMQIGVSLKGIIRGLRKSWTHAHRGDNCNKPIANNRPVNCSILW